MVHIYYLLVKYFLGIGSGDLHLTISIFTALIQTFLIVHQSSYSIFPSFITNHLTFLQLIFLITALENF